MLGWGKNTSTFFNIRHKKVEQKFNFSFNIFCYKNKGDYPDTKDKKGKMKELSGTMRKKNLIVKKDKSMKITIFCVPKLQYK